MDSDDDLDPTASAASISCRLRILCHVPPTEVRGFGAADSMRADAFDAAGATDEALDGR